jgi:hypothetical protein
VSDAEPIVFKVEDSIWQLMREGKKHWDARLYDTSDNRFIRLSAGYWRPGHKPRYMPSESLVQFLNKDTGEILEYQYCGLRFIGWAQGWCFLQLGRLIEVYEPDGVPESLEERAGKMEQEIDQAHDREEAESG